MIIWRGLGFLVPVVFALGIIVGGGWGGAIGALVASLAVWFLGKRLNAPVDRHDPESGEMVPVGNRHTLYFLPMQWWSVPGVVLTLAASGMAMTPADGSAREVPDAELFRVADRTIDTPAFASLDPSASCP